MVGAWTLTWAANISAQTNVLPRIPAAAATNYLNQEVIVTDRVAQVTIRPTIVFLNLNQRYPDSPLTCVIKGSDTNNFPDLKNYQDKEVEVSGRIADFQGRPEIVLTTTNQIKILTDIQSTQPVVQPGTNEARPLPPAATRPAAKITRPAQQPAVEAAQTPVQMVWWIVGSLAVIIALLGFLVFLFWRKGVAGSSALSVHSMSTLPALPEGASLSVEDWKQRALVAEAMAGRQGQMLREKIMPELTEFAKQSLVQGLYAQRNALIERQQKAQQALAEFESRLAALQLPFQERIRAYEKRIVELEKEVETQGEEMRELTHATLVLVRKKLEDERENERTQSRFN